MVQDLERAGEIGSKILAAYPGLKLGPQESFMETLRFENSI